MLTYTLCQLPFSTCISQQYVCLFFSFTCPSVKTQLNRLNIYTFQARIFFVELKQRLDVIVLAEALSAADVLVKRCQCCKITAQQWTQVHQFYVTPTSERRFSVYCCGLPARLCLRRVLIIAFHVKVSTKQSSLQKYGLFIPTDRHFEQIERGEEILISKL